VDIDKSQNALPSDIPLFLTLPPLGFAELTECPLLEEILGLPQSSNTLAITQKGNRRCHNIATPPQQENNLILSHTFEREVMSCPYCHLRQYRTHNNLCRRCHRPLLMRTSGVPSGASLSESTQAASASLHLIGGVIRNLRMQHGMSQMELACAMDTHRSYVSRLECGHLIPSLLTLERIAHTFRVEVIDLLAALHYLDTKNDTNSKQNSQL
jgi:ribosome-binding protein aMBF1 (putative translation factor)